MTQVIGLTATLPDVVPDILPGSDSGPHEWNYIGTSLWHNWKKILTDLPHLNYLQTNQTVSLLLTTDGHLHVYHDGQLTKNVATDFPVNHYLWGAVDVKGNCTKIKSELLSGELDGVCMYLYFIVS